MGLSKYHVWKNAGMSVALGPKTPYATDIPAFFQTWYFDIILDGAAFKLLSQPNKPYTNDKLAVYYGKRFRAAMARARDMARRQFTTADTAFVFPPWA